jgi:CO dehydrogenase/acetyl-CoA synthase epsilon subunit
LYIIGNRLKGHRAFVDWAKNVTGLDEAGVQALAKEVRDELNISLPKAPMQGDTIIHTKSGAVDRVMTEQTTPKEVVTPFVPKGVEVKSVLNDDDVAVMENVLGLKPRGVGFVDVKTGRFVSAKTVDERLEKAGIQVQRAAPEGELGMPRQMPSVGAAGVRPQAVYGADLAGRVADVDAQEALMRTAAGQDIMEREAIRTSGKLVNIQRRAATKLKNSILKDHNDLADFIVKAKEEDRILSAEEIAAIKPLVEDALQHRMSVINEISEFVARGADLDSPEALRMAEDLLYYSGIHQFYLNQGTLASRSLNARKIVKRALDKKSPLKNIFPTVSC